MAVGVPWCQREGKFMSGLARNGLVWSFQVVDGTFLPILVPIARGDSKDLYEGGSEEGRLTDFLVVWSRTVCCPSIRKEGEVVRGQGRQMWQMGLNVGETQGLHRGSCDQKSVFGSMVVRNE